jgi:type I restriction enzyme M protein
MAKAIAQKFTTKGKTKKKAIQLQSPKRKAEPKQLTESEKLRKFEKDLWDVACKLWTNTNLKPVDYKIPVLALIFLRFADQKFSTVKATLSAKSSRRDPGPDDYKAKGVLYLSPEARWDYLKAHTEGDDVGAAINKAMTLIEDHNEDLKGILPKTFNRFNSKVILDLMRVFHGAQELEGDNFGRIYEFFMSEFEKDSGQKGGEFFTPPSIVKLIVEIIEPYHGKIYDPACGSGGMFAQSAKFVEAHKKRPSEELAAFGQEKTAETIKIAKMNLAISGFSGTIKSGNSYYDDEHRATGKFDFVMANPPFNAAGVDKERIKDDKNRFPFGMPTPDNANFLWVQLFYSSLNDKGRAGFVMANSASDARGSEQEIRKAIIQTGAVDVMVAISSNFFYTVTLPVTLWFFDKAKPKKRKNEVLFIDARNIFTAIKSSLREYSTEQLEFIANIVRAYRGERLEFTRENKEFQIMFPDGKYSDIKGLCAVKTISEIEAQGWSLNPGRYVGSEIIEIDDELYLDKLNEYSSEFQSLISKSRKLEDAISNQLKVLLT